MSDPDIVRIIDLLQKGGDGIETVTTEGEVVSGQPHFGPKDCCDGKYGQPHERWCRYWRPDQGHHRPAPAQEGGDTT